MLCRNKLVTMYLVVAMLLVLELICSHGYNVERRGRTWFVSSSGNDTTNCGLTETHSCKSIRHTVSKSSENDSIILKGLHRNTFIDECGVKLDNAIPIKHNITIESKITEDRPAIIDCQNGYGFLLNAPLTVKNVIIENARTAFIQNSGVLTLENVTMQGNYYGVACPALLRPESISGNSSVSIRATRCHFLNNTRSVTTLENSVNSADFLDVEFDWCVFDDSPFTLFALNYIRIVSTDTHYSGTGGSLNKPCPMRIYTTAPTAFIWFLRGSFDAFPTANNYTASLLWISMFAVGETPPTRRLDMAFIDVVFQNSQSSKWSSILVGGGCDVYFGRISFENCTFRNNSGRYGMVRVSSDMPCPIHFNNCTFHNNFVSAVGGAIKIGRNTDVTINNSRFFNDSALYAGGTIYSEGSLTLSNTIVENSPKHSLQGDIFFGTGKINIMGDVLFSAKHSVDDSAIFWADIAKIKIHGNYTLVCPKERILHEINASPLDPMTGTSMRAYYCKTCGANEYTFDQGTVVTGNLSKQGRCNPCPFWAVCTKGHIAATPTFWGYRDPDGMVALLSCPSGYCCSDKHECREYNSCRATRRGTLCGECLSGYSETLLSSKCKSDKECHDSWVWLIALILVVAFVLFLLHSDEVEAFLYRQVFWWQRGKGEALHKTTLIQSNTDSELEDLSKSYDTKSVAPETINKGYKVIIFYYYQAASFLHIQPVFHNHSAYTSPINSLLALFKLQPFFLGSSHGYVCPVTGLTALGKILVLGFSTVLPPIIVLGVIYVIYRAVDWYRTARRPAGEHASMLDYETKCITTLLSLFLLSYASMASMTFTLLHCVQVGDSNVLFKVGYLACYQSWQYIFMVYAAVSVFPLWIVVGVAPYLVRAGLASSKEVICACVLPLPVLVLWLVKWLQRKRHTTEFQLIVPQRQEMPLRVISVLDGPFFTAGSEEGLGPIYWQGVFTARRLALASINVFVHDPANKLLCLTLVCVFILCHHIWIKPFNTQFANNLETASLVSLGVLALMNLVKGVLNSGGYELRPGSDLEKLVEATEWWENAVLWLPLVLVFLFVFFSQFLRLIIIVAEKIKRRCYCCNKSY